MVPSICVRSPLEERNNQYQLIYGGKETNRSNAMGLTILMEGKSIKIF